ncbi:MAG: DUF1203 domain-containing protein [Rhodobacteraceae bacterium]|nr:DUF1203 domain-containing protein [Paracoccaceae bacterium]
MITFTPLPTEEVRALQGGGPDAYGRVPERAIATGEGEPCRHCLRQIPAGAPYLIVAHRPFPALQPYAETGPIFLCAHACEAGGGAGLPETLSSPSFFVKGYGANDRILYGTGAVIDTQDITDRAEDLLARPEVAYVHVRSAANNCYAVRIDRAVD